MTESNNYSELAEALLERPVYYATLRLKLWALTHPEEPLSNDIIMTLSSLDTSEHLSDQLMEAIQDLYDLGKCKQFTFKSEYGGWTIGTPGEKPAFFYDLKGFQYLHKLLSKPGEEIHCNELADVKIVENDIPATEKKTLADMKQQHSKLKEQKNSALNRGDETLAAKYDAEMEEIEAYLKSTTGKHGRIRKHGSGEKARQSVKKAIDAALDKIRLECLAAHQALKITTGHSCAYIGSEEWNI